MLQAYKLLLEWNSSFAIFFVFPFLGAKQVGRLTNCERVKDSKASLIKRLDTLLIQRSSF